MDGFAGSVMSTICIPLRRVPESAYSFLPTLTNSMSEPDWASPESSYWRLATGDISLPTPASATFTPRSAVGRSPPLSWADAVLAGRMARAMAAAPARVPARAFRIIIAAFELGAVSTCNDAGSSGLRKAVRRGGAGSTAQLVRRRRYGAAVKVHTTVVVESGKG